MLIEKNNFKKLNSLSKRNSSINIDDITEFNRDRTFDCITRSNHNFKMKEKMCD